MRQAHNILFYYVLFSFSHKRCRFDIFFVVGVCVFVAAAARIQISFSSLLHFSLSCSWSFIHKQFFQKHMQQQQQ